jgi:hypothetical protein
VRRWSSWHARSVRENGRVLGERAVGRASWSMAWLMLVSAGLARGVSCKEGLRGCCARADCVRWATHGGRGVLGRAVRQVRVACERGGPGRVDWVGSVDWVGPAEPSGQAGPSRSESGRAV